MSRRVHGVDAPSSSEPTVIKYDRAPFWLVAYVEPAGCPTSHAFCVAWLARVSVSLTSHIETAMRLFRMPKRRQLAAVAALILVVVFFNAYIQKTYDTEHAAPRGAAATGEDVVTAPAGDGGGAHTRVEHQGKEDQHVVQDQQDEQDHAAMPDPTPAPAVLRHVKEKKPAAVTITGVAKGNKFKYTDKEYRCTSTCL